MRSAGTTLSVATPLSCIILVSYLLGRECWVVLVWFGDSVFVKRLDRFYQCYEGNVTQDGACLKLCFRSYLL